MEFTYPDVGATREMTSIPAGYKYVERRGLLGEGAAFDRGRAALREWRMFTSAGFAVRTSEPAVREGAEVRVGIGAGPARLWAPCRVVWVVDEPDRYGFGYGTLPGHPASGEEAFVVVREPDASARSERSEPRSREQDLDGKVWFEVRAFSRPATWYAKVGGPATRATQRWAAGRYLRAMRQLVTS